MTLAWCLPPLALQGLAMLVDEGWFHRRRGLPRWERVGHPIDTLALALCVAWLVVARPGDAGALEVYVGLGIVSTLVITKDEPVHARHCTAGEHWLHAVLFVLHPIVLGALGVLWWYGAREVVIGQLVVVLAFMAYQVVYWNVVVPRRERAAAAINNRWYADLGAKWYDATDTPIALLRAEARHRNPWIAETIARQLGPGRWRVLDVGCGAGLLANDLARRGLAVTGLDPDAESLAVARARDVTRTVTYQRGDAYALPYRDGAFDAVCAMDLLEHVEAPAHVIAELARVLRPGGVFFFHTFNRTWQANLIVIKGVAWFVKNAPDDLHVLRLFITPDELEAMCRAHGFAHVRIRGSRPRFTWPLWRMLLTGRVEDDFAFTFTESTKLGYTGYARRGDGGTSVNFGQGVRRPDVGGEVARCSTVPG